MLSLIVAMSRNRVIGKNNQLPWQLPADLAWFREKTLNKPIIMGRKTFESIGRPLPKRTNIVLSRQPFVHEGTEWQPSLENAVDSVKNYPEVMLIGGGELFKQALPMTNRFYLTEIQAEIEGDTFFPELDWAEWHIEFEQYRPKDDNNCYDCRFLILTRKK